MRVDQLSGDSDAFDLQYRAGIVTLRFEDGETGRTHLLRVATDVLLSETSDEFGSVHVRLADKLPVDPTSGIYIVPSNFGPLMKIVRDGLHLALGRRASDFPLLLQVRGYKIVLACPIRSADDVQVVDADADAEHIKESDGGGN